MGSTSALVHLSKRVSVVMTHGSGPGTSWTLSIRGNEENKRATRSISKPSAHSARDPLFKLVLRARLRPQSSKQRARTHDRDMASRSSSAKPAGGGGGPRRSLSAVENQVVNMTCGLVMPATFVDKSDFLDGLQEQDFAEAPNGTVSLRLVRTWAQRR